MHLECWKASLAQCLTATAVFALNHRIQVRPHFLAILVFGKSQNQMRCFKLSDQALPQPNQQKVSTRCVPLCQLPRGSNLKMSGMTKQRALGIYRLFFMGLAFAAIGVQLALSLRRETFDVLNFISFFTIESNLIAAYVFLVTGSAPLYSTDRGQFAMLRGLATLSMTMTGGHLLPTS